MIDDITTGRHSLNLIESEVFSTIRAALATSPDYHGEAAAAVDMVLRLIIRYVTTRTNAQSDLYPFLFDPNAKEDAIHRNLHDYLSSTDLGSITESEVQHVGGGRVDLRLKFDGFAIHIEMKVDSTKVPMNDKAAYLKQAAAYQRTDIRIGFLVALRHKAFDPSGPPPHLSALIGHTAFDIEGDSIPRHIVTVQVPGSRTKPSKMSSPADSCSHPNIMQGRGQGADDWDPKLAGHQPESQEHSHGGMSEPDEVQALISYLAQSPGHCVEPVPAPSVGGGG